MPDGIGALPHTNTECRTQSLGMDEIEFSTVVQSTSRNHAGLADSADEGLEKGEAKRVKKNRVMQQTTIHVVAKSEVFFAKKRAKSSCSQLRRLF